jgi:hypothetical protein
MLPSEAVTRPRTPYIQDAFAPEPARDAARNIVVGLGSVSDRVKYPRSGGMFPPRVSGLTVIALLLLTAGPAQGSDNGFKLALGGGPEARVVAGQWGGAGSVEATLTYVPVVSLSAGLAASAEGVDYAYGELCVHPIVSLGGGLGYGAYSNATGRHAGLAGHMFLGLPIPLVKGPLEVTEKGRIFAYLLPYYRPSWGPWPGTAHELGFMLKFSYALSSLDYGGKGW